MMAQTTATLCPFPHTLRASMTRSLSRGSSVSIGVELSPPILTSVLDVEIVIIIRRAVMDTPINRMSPIHPGEILADELRELGLSARAFAEALGVPHNRVAAILRGQRAITADTALRLGQYFGTTAKFWLNLQQSHDLKVAERKCGRRIRATVKRRAA